MFNGPLTRAQFQSVLWTFRDNSRLQIILGKSILNRWHRYLKYIGTSTSARNVVFPIEGIGFDLSFRSIYAAERCFLFRYLVTLLFLEAHSFVISLIWIHLKGDGQAFSFMVYNRYVIFISYMVLHDNAYDIK